MTKPKILAFAGSTRIGSLNKILIKIAADHARHEGGDVTFVDLRDFPMPLYDGDLEESGGLPETAKKFKTLLREHDGFLISSPEYNSSVTGVLKNAIDWASRTETDDEPSLVAFRGKVAGLLAASPGGLGGLRGLVHLRAILGNIGVLVLPDQIAISAADKAFNASGQFNDESKNQQIKSLADKLVQTISKLKG